MIARRPGNINSPGSVLSRPPNPMAMVRHSPASQATSRPSWPAAPTSSTPPDTDDPVSHVTTGSLHGAIGEHRRSSRSSSVSSGGSSTNSAEGHDLTRPQSQGRFALSSLPHQSSSDSALEQSAAPAASLATLGQRLSPDQKETVESFSTNDGKQSQVASEEESRVGLGLPMTSEPFVLPRADSLDSSFSYFMAGQNSLDEHTFSDTPRQGRPITGPNTASMPIDINQLFDHPFATRQIAPTIRQDFSSIGATAYGLSSDSLNLPHVQDADMGFFGASRHPSTNTAFGTNFSDGAYQPMMNQGSSQFSPNFYTGSQSMNALGNRGGTGGSNYYPQQQPGFNSAAPGFYSPNRQGGGDYFSSPGGFQAYGSQDFSLPPPAQPWRTRPVNPNIPEAVLKKITCESCSRIYKWPHVLECLHVSCFPCIVAKYNAGDNTVTCEKCSRKTTPKNGPCGLHLDYETCRYMRDLNFPPFSCTSCTRDQEAVTCCLTCMAFLCAECRDGHRNIHQLQTHQLVSITKTGKAEDGDYVPLCEKHAAKPLTKYCCICEHLICVACVPDHVHPDFPHKEGNSHDLEPIFDIIAERLNNWNEDASIKKKDIIEMEKQVPALLQTVEAKKRSIRKQIDDYTEYCKTVVEQNRSVAYEMLERTVGVAENNVHQWAKSCADVHRELDAVTSFNIRTTKMCIHSEAIYLLFLMESEYKRVVGNYAKAAKNNESLKVDIKFDPNYKESHAVLNQNFTSISYVINDVEQKVSPTSGNQRGEFTRGRGFPDYSMSGSDNTDCNYQRWSAAPDSMSISTWNNGNERDRKSGTFIPHLNRCRTKTSYIHMFGEYGRGEYAFTEPSGQAYLNDGSYVICDTNNHRIVYYSAKHEYIRTIGQPPNLPPVAEEQDQRSSGPRGKGFARQDGYLYFPNRVAICPITQNIVATERPPSHDVQIFTVEGDFVRCFGGNILQHPRGVTVDEEGIIIVVECKVMKLVMFNQDGSFIVSHSLTKDLEFPNDVAAKDKKIFISDNRGHCVQVFNYNAEFLYKIGNESITYFPIGVSINYLNQVVVTDNHNTFNITVFDIQGQVLHIFESVSKLAQCHNVAVHPSSLELMLTTKDCSVYFFNYDPNITHPLAPPASRGGGHLNSNTSIVRRTRGGNGNGGSTNSFF